MSNKGLTGHYNKKTLFLNVIVFFTSLFLCFIVAEISLRIIIFSTIGVFEKQRRPELYADEYSEDDYWKLHYLFRKIKANKNRKNIEHKATPKPNKRLLTRFVLRDTYEHVNQAYVNNRRPVLLYGDSFAACYSQDDCFDHILNSDATFSKNHYLLNYGVGGYGLDQIYLLFKNSIDNYQNPIVVISLMTLDLDRSILSVRDLPKPYFTVDNAELNLHEPRMEPPYSRSEIEDYFSNNKPQITSYIYRRMLYSEFLAKLMPDRLFSYLREEDYYKRKKIQVNQKIMIEIINELKSRELEFVFLIFHPEWIRGSGFLNENIDDWRDIFIRNVLDKNNITYIWSKDIIFQNMKAENLSLRDYFVPNDGHPTLLQKKLLSEKIKEVILASKLPTN